jgi:hypothetical protein
MSHNELTFGEALRVLDSIQVIDLTLVLIFFKIDAYLVQALEVLYAWSKPQTCEMFYCNCDPGLMLGVRDMG